MVVSLTSFSLDKVSVAAGERTACYSRARRLNDGENPAGATVNTTATRCHGLSADESGAGELEGGREIAGYC